MARHSTQSSGDNSLWMIILIGGVAYYLYTQGYFTNLLNAVQGVIPASVQVTPTNAQGTPSQFIAMI